jgi:hypothetical protein
MMLSQINWMDSIMKSMSNYLSAKPWQVLLDNVLPETEEWSLFRKEDDGGCLKSCPHYKKCSSNHPEVCHKEWRNEKSSRLHFEIILHVMNNINHYHRKISSRKLRDLRPEVNDIIDVCQDAIETLPESGKNPNSPLGKDLERRANARKGQAEFRMALEERWRGRCAVTGLSVRSLLRASHIKPWAECPDNSTERITVDNGLLLSANLDAAFDAGLISFSDTGSMLISQQLAKEDKALLGLTNQMQLRSFHKGMKKYLKLHRRKHGFKDN